MLPNCCAVSQTRHSDLANGSTDSLGVFETHVQNQEDGCLSSSGGPRYPFYLFASNPQQLHTLLSVTRFFVTAVFKRDYIFTLFTALLPATSVRASHHLFPSCVFFRTDYWVRCAFDTCRIFVNIHADAEYVLSHLLHFFLHYLVTFFS